MGVCMSLKQLNGALPAFTVARPEGPRMWNCSCTCSRPSPSLYTLQDRKGAGGGWGMGPCSQVLMGRGTMESPHQPIFSGKRVLSRHRRATRHWSLPCASPVGDALARRPVLALLAVGGDGGACRQARVESVEVGQRGCSARCVHPVCPASSLVEPATAPICYIRALPQALPLLLVRWLLKGWLMPVQAVMVSQWHVAHPTALLLLRPFARLRLRPSLRLRSRLRPSLRLSPRLRSRLRPRLTQAHGDAWVVLDLGKSVVEALQQREAGRRGEASRMGRGRLAGGGRCAALSIRALAWAKQVNAERRKGWAGQPAACAKHVQCKGSAG